jgi:hypothetical protein
VLVENLHVRLIRPPVPVRPGTMRLGSRGWDCWVFAFADAFRHVGPSPVSLFPFDSSLLLTLAAPDPRLCCSAGVERCVSAISRRTRQKVPRHTPDIDPSR